MNCIFKRESQTTEGVDYKQKETPCECTTQFWERSTEWKCHVVEMTWCFFFFLFEMISSHKLPHSCWRVVGLQGLELPLKAKINGILPTSAPAKHRPAFIWFRGRGGGGALSPYPTGFLTATVNIGPLKGHSVCHP